MLPTRAKPVPLDPLTGKRTVGDFEFFYDGWKAPSATAAWSGAMRKKIFPEERKGYLDYSLLQKLED